MTQYVNILKMKSIMTSIAKGKGEIVKIDESAAVPAMSVELWKKRGLPPKPFGIAIVRFPGNDKDYIFPLEFEV